MPLDDKEDLTKLDRGDNFEAARDDKGRFASKDPEAPEEEEEEEKPVVEEPAEPEDEGDEGDDEGKPVNKDDKNYAIRLAKAQLQRDAARAEKAELAERLAAIEAKLAAATPAAPAPKADPRAELELHADGLYEKVEAARADGDVKQAALLQRELDKVNRQINRYEASAIASNTTGRVSENQTYNSMLDTAETVIDAINPNSPDFDRAAVTELQETIEAYEARGFRPSEALNKAIKAIYRVDLASGVLPQIRAEAPAPKPAPRKPNVAKAVDAANRQPPDASSRGSNRDDGKVTISQLSEDDLAKLPASKRAELRGDFV